MTYVHSKWIHLNILMQVNNIKVDYKTPDTFEFHKQATTKPR